MEYILGFFTIVGGLSAVWYFWDKYNLKKKNSEISNNSIVTNDIQISDIKEIIQNYYRSNEYSPFEVKRCDLSNVGNQNEIIVHSHNGQNEFIDVFSLKNLEPENIFHCKSEIDEEVNTYVHSFFDHNHFIYTVRSGSGGFLHVFIYSYDNISKLELCFQRKDLYHGSIFFIPNKILLSGDSTKYELIKDNSEFRLIHYHKKLLDSIGDDSFLLSFSPVDSKFDIILNNKPIRFRNDNGKYVAIDNYSIGLDDQIIVDDNFTNNESAAFKLLVNGLHFSFNQGYYYLIKPIKTGVADISIQFKHEWYIITFIIE